MPAEARTAMENGMLRRRCRGAELFEFGHLAEFPELAHGIFARAGGHSLPPFDRLNVSLAVGDRDEAVRRNRELVAGCLGAGRLIFARQIHGAEVLPIEETPLDPAPAGFAAARPGDAMVCAAAGTGLVVQVADCQAILLYDPRRRVVANVHSGWRGNIAGVAGRAVAVMAERYGCLPGDILAGIGPSLGPCCAEFVNFRQEIPRELWAYRRPGSDHFDFWSMSRDQLVDAGVPADRIRASGLCTRCRTDLFFSYRGEKKTGRFPAVIGLKPTAG
jgi:hypothetical protein